MSCRTSEVPANTPSVGNSPCGRGHGAGSFRWRLRGFSLLEVVAAVVIFAIGMVAVLGMFAPVTKSVSTLAEAEAAARVADALRARLQALGFAEVMTRGLVQTSANVRKNDGDPNYNPNDGTKNPAVIFGKLNGDVGIYDSGRQAWTDSTVPQAQTVLDADKFFEVDLIRNETLSPETADPTAAMVAFNLRVRWPAFVRTSATTAVANGQNPGGAVPFDHSRKQVLFFTGSISR